MVLSSTGCCGVDGEFYSRFHIGTYHPDLCRAVCRDCWHRTSCSWIARHNDALHNGFDSAGFRDVTEHIAMEFVELLVARRHAVESSLATKVPGHSVVAP